MPILAAASLHESEAHMEPRISFVTLGVADIAASRAFYERLGFTASSKSNEHITFFQFGPVVFGLYGREALAEDARLADRGALGPGQFGGIALAHNVREREDVARVLAEAEAAGAMIAKPAEDTFWGGHAGYFTDPDGHAWEVAWNPFMAIDDAGGVRLGG